MDTKFLSAPESNNTLAKCWFRRNVPMTTFGSRHDKLLTLVGVFITQGKASSIPNVFSWGGSISPKGFLPSILLLAIMIVAVAIVVTVVLVVVDAIIGNHALLSDPPAYGLCWWLPPKFKALKQQRSLQCFRATPPIKTSISFSVFGTIFRHKTANSWNLLTIPPKRTSTFAAPAMTQAAIRKLVADNVAPTLETQTTTTTNTKNTNRNAGPR
nr:hypothetical protein [Tanacetum cinerariifolium]